MITGSGRNDGAERKGLVVRNKDILDLATELAQQTGDDPTVDLDATSPKTDEASGKSELPPQRPISPPRSAVSDSSFFQPVAPTKERKTADELTAMIIADLSQVKGCPTRGLKIAVYGSNPWNVWLSFAEAGPIPNKTELQDFLEIITERLKRLYDVML